MKSIRETVKSIYEKQQDSAKDHDNKGKYINKKI